MDKLVETFIELAKIPSPSLGEEKVADKIIEILQEENIKAQKDDYGNVYAYIEATDNTKRPLMGEVSGRIADFTIITTDNAREEKPEDIAKEIEKGLVKV